jgi:hypothetical protein
VEFLNQARRFAMKALTTALIVVVSIVGLAGLYLSLKGDVATAPVVASAAR